MGQIWGRCGAGEQCHIWPAVYERRVVFEYLTMIIMWTSLSLSYQQFYNFLLDGNNLFNNLVFHFQPIKLHIPTKFS